MIGDSTVSHDNHMQATWCESDSGFHLEFLSRGGANATIPELRAGGGGAKTMVRFSILEE